MADAQWEPPEDPRTPVSEPSRFAWAFLGVIILIFGLIVAVVSLTW